MTAARRAAPYGGDDVPARAQVWQAVQVAWEDTRVEQLKFQTLRVPALRAELTAGDSYGVTSGLSMR